MTLSKPSKWLRLFLCCAIAMLITLLAITAASAHSPDTIPVFHSSAHVRSPSLSPSTQATPEPDPTPNYLERLAPPPMSDPPTQAELGHYAYYISCMVCHGDRGQGLTEEWRAMSGPQDQNCWQSKCHAPNHPPEGFEIPRYAPPIMGEGTLTNYETAADLHEFIHVNMPWPFPGILSEEEYWQLTAFLADAHGASWNEELLGPDNAANVFLYPPTRPPQRSAVKLEQAATWAILVLLVGTSILERWTQTR